MNIKMFTDGACRGNPGLCGIGVVYYDERGVVIDQFSKTIGILTNNQAEYFALIHGLFFVPKLPEALEKLDVYTDSRLMVMQITENHKVKTANLAPLCSLAKQLLGKIPSWSLHHIPREENRVADKLASQAIMRHAQ